MTRERAVLLAAIALAVLASCGTVEEPVIPPAWKASDLSGPLTHDDCVRLALHAAPTAAAWRAKLDAASAKLAIARKPANPTLSAGWEDFGLFGASGIPVQQTFTLAYALEDLFARGRRSDAAGFDFEAELAALRIERQATAAEVHRAYDRLVVARARVDLQRELEAASVREHEALARFVASGLAAHFELERAEAEAAEARRARARAETDARAQELALSFALGFERPTALALADSITPPPATPGDLEALLAMAAAARPELTQARRKYEAELERLKIAASAVRFLPKLSFGPRFGGGPMRGVAALDVELPIFDSGAAATDAQRAELLAAAAALRAAAQRVAADVASAQDRLDGATALLHEHSQPQAERRRALRERARKAFAAGEAEFSTVVLAGRDEIAARTGVLDANLDVAEAAVALSAALGRYATEP